MKIAVPVTKNNQIDDHFGHCEYYNVFSISSDKQIKGIETIASQQGCGCKSNIAGILSDKGVTVMLAGGIGVGAIQVLQSWGIEVVRGCSGDASNTVMQYISGAITDSGKTCETHDHHSVGDSHVCSHN
jgi:predicted Fe-Mo cluster-binding NifX family protein